MIVPRNSASAEERAEVELLLAQAEKQKDFNKRLEASVVRVEDIARKLDEAMGPVYNDTQSLSVVTNSEDPLAPSGFTFTDHTLQMLSEFYRNSGGRQSLWKVKRSKNEPFAMGKLPKVQRFSRADSQFHQASSCWSAKLPSIFEEC